MYVYTLQTYTRTVCECEVDVNTLQTYTHTVCECEVDVNTTISENVEIMSVDYRG